MRAALSPVPFARVATLGGAWVAVVLLTVVSTGCPVQFKSCVSNADCAGDGICFANGLCGLDDPNEPEALPRDGGRDAGMDGGVVGLDGGDELDAGDVDAGHRIDSGVLDAGPPIDASVVIDAGPFIDGGVDAGPLSDAGLPDFDCDGDNDGDGYGDGCDFGPDCDDTDRTIFRTIVIFADDDGDGFGAGSPVQQGCFGLDIPVGRATNRSDCDDTDPNRFVLQAVYADNDGDTIPSATLTTECVGAVLPVGFSASPPGGQQQDCDDADARRGSETNEVCNGIDDNCDGVIDEGDICNATGCTRVEHPDTGAPYLHCLQPATFEAAQANCKSVGYAAVSLETHSEMVFVSELAAQSPPHGDYSINGSQNSVWVGATDRDVEGTFVWESGFPFSTAPFIGDNNPDNFGDEDCLEWHSDNRGFNDALCTAERVMVCEPQAQKTTLPISWPVYTPEPIGACVDEDDDGFGRGCALGPDCDDDRGADFRLYMGYIDEDDDNVYGGVLANACGGSDVPNDLLETLPESIDCDDTDDTIRASRTLYLDGDGDGVPNAVAIDYECRDGQPPTNALPQADVFDCRDDDDSIFPGTPELCDAIDNDCDSDVDEDACFCETLQFDGKGYLFCQGRVGVDPNAGNDDIETALTTCSRQGGRLPVVPDSLVENNFISGGFANGITNSWIGLLYDTPTGEWRDPYETVVDDEIDPPSPWPNQPFTRWAGGQPDSSSTEPCVRMAANGRWHDTGCSGAGRSTVCE